MNLLASEFDTTTAWKLSDQVSLRDEAFGALAYHHRTRRLVFLKSPELVALIRRLEDFESADAAIASIAPPDQHERYARALSSLRRSEILGGR